MRGAPPNQPILDLSLVNSYFAEFDDTKDINGIIPFAPIQPPA